MNNRFRLAPMSGTIRVVTVLLLLLPITMLVVTVTVSKYLAGPLVLIILVYVWIWLRFRPTAFVIHPGTLEIVWPLRRRQLSRNSIQGLRILTAAELKRQTGRCARVGAGGLWGGFGL